ncbi:hypothetical protein BWI93_12490 [Siphonobacter sp. BAB-5385]|nr:hypothetical protein BWI93_12490 [Siphonobacter sp. BAB-5385]
MTIADGTQGAGKVLTSDANGGASWQVGKVGCGSFDATRSTAQNVPILDNVTDPAVVLVSTTKVYDPLNAYNPSTGEYTIPSTGMYVFKSSAVDYIPGIAARRNSTLTIVSAVRGALSSSVTADQAYLNGTYNDVVAVAYLTAGDKVTAKCQITHISGTKPAATIDVQNIKFSGSRIDCTSN